jgi:hypothetical protein
VQSKEYGQPIQATDKVVVSDNEEIPVGNSAYIVNKSQLEYDTIVDTEWNRFLNGDVHEIVSLIETQIQGAKVKWIRLSWDHTEIFHDGYNFIEGRWVDFYHVYGLTIEAVVLNETGAALTGLEIFTILIAVGFLIAIVTGCALGAWITYKLTTLPEPFGSAFGIIILIGIVFFILVMFGAKFKGKRGKTSVSVGR